MDIVSRKSINDNLRKYDYLAKENSFIEVTEWGNGEWFEKGEMGWWGVAFDEKPEDSWKTQFSEYLKEVDSDCLVTVVDFHI